MLSKPGIIYLFLITLVTMPACVTTTSTVEPTKAPTEEPKPTAKPENNITKNCHPEGTEALISPDEEYCLAHPYGYYSYEMENEPNIFFVQSGNHSLTGGPEPTTLSTPVILRIRQEAENNDEDLMKFIGRDANVNLNDLSPWHLSGKKAFIAKTHRNQTVIYYIYTKHNGKFYILEFSAGVSLSDEGACADELEKLLFTVNETFTFLD